MKRKILFILLAVIVLSVCYPMTASANSVYINETESAAVSVPVDIDILPVSGDEMESIIVPLDESDQLPDSDDLLSMYMDETLNQQLNSQGEMQGSVRDLKKNLSAGSARLFDALKTRIREVADGKRTSTAFTLSFQNDLGLVSSAEASSQTKAAEQAYAKLNLDANAVFHALLADCPYHLYWFDKGVSVTYSYNWTYRLRNGTYKVTLDSMTISFPAAADYAGSNEYTVDKGKISAVQKSLNTISSIIKEYNGKSDVEKLRAYKDRICALTSYNSEAAGNHTTHYVNPWQLIWVFDNDPSTTVVCEGYAKAFQYLCDLSSFQGPVYCSSVTGITSDSSGSGAHMWNIVHMDDGLNFLVDVTNCDNGSTGDDLLFMVKPSSGDVSTAYRFDCGFFSIEYRYDSSTRMIYSVDDLMLSRSLFKDVRENDYFLEPVLWAVNKGITKGTSQTAFSPAAACTRGQAVTFLWRASGSKKVTGVVNPFTDVSPSDYYYDAVLWALKNGITSGMTETSFGPGINCTRSQIVTFLWRSKKQSKAGAAVSFTDVPKNAYYYAAVQWAVEKGITKGTSPTAFSPEAVCTRGQIVTFLYRALA